MSRRSDQLHEAARELRREAERVGSSNRHAARMVEELSFTGPAADALRVETRERSVQLDRVSGDLLEAAATLTALANSLEASESSP